MLQLPDTGNPYLQKDQRKADMCNKIIGMGHPSSSTGKYVKALKEVANTGVYDENDWVFISVNGERHNRISPYYYPLLSEIEKAARAGVTFVADNKHDRSRKYNIGERELETILIAYGYEDTDGDGIWHQTGEIALI